MGDKFQQIVKACNGGIKLEVNSHLDISESIESYLPSYVKEKIDPKVLQRMVDLNQLVELEITDDSEGSIAMYNIYHHDISEAIEVAHKALFTPKAPVA